MNNYYFYAALVFGGILFAILLAYLPRIVAWFGFTKPYEHLHNEKKNRIAVLVPARNESEVIRPLLESLAHQTYAEKEVFVIVKDPKDPTIALAKERGFMSTSKAPKRANPMRLMAPFRALSPQILILLTPISFSTPTR